MERLNCQVIVSLTSYPARVKTLATVLEPILNQTYPADKILLWLAEEQFPSKEKNLPQDLKALTGRGLEIRWCDDIKTHKKYFYTMQEFPDDVIITIDDDAVYTADLIETLLKSYSKYPKAISAMRIHKIMFNVEGDILPYNSWKKEYNHLDMPSLQYMATGVGGVLYPPHSLPPETFNKEAIVETCLFGDDLWLKIMEVMNNIPVVLAQKHSQLKMHQGTQESALWHDNVYEGRNDSQLSKILEKYNYQGESAETLIDRMNPCAHLDKIKISVIVPVYNAAEYLSDTLESILTQTCTNLEVICVNDGSTDNSLNILEEYKKKDPRIIILNTPNKGPGGARNEGISVATGEYLTFCDADDYLPTYSLEVRLREALEKKADIVVGNYREIFPTGEIKNSPPLSEMKDGFWMIYASSVVLWNKLYKTKFIRQCNIEFLSLKQGEDRVYITELYTHNPSIAAVSDNVYDWIRRPDIGASLSYTDNSAAFFERMKSWLITYDIFERNNVRQANQLLIGWSGYLKSLFDNMQVYEQRPQAFEVVKDVMRYGKWDLAYSKFRAVWGMEPQDFFTVSYAEYTKRNTIINPGPIYWYPDEGIKPRMKTFSGIMPIVIVADEAYALPTAAMLISIKSNRKLTSCYEVNILSNNISDESKQKLKYIADDMFKVNIIEMQQKEILPDIPSQTAIDELPANHSALYKFCIPNLFEKYDKVLYLDCDLLVMDDLSPLFNIDLSGRYVAASADSLQFLRPPHFKRIQSSNKTYFNSGVMLLNLKKMREDNIVNSLIDYRINGINYYMDQDAFNVVFNDNVVYIPFYYNMDYTTLRKFNCTELRKYYHLGKYDRLPVLYRRAKIFHFTGFSKPWKYNVPYFTKLYDSYLTQTLFSDNIGRRETIKNPINEKQHFSNAPIDKSQTEIYSLQREIDLLRASKSYKIGRFITFIPRKVRGGIRCMQDHGSAYTLSYAKSKLKKVVKNFQK